MNTLTDSQKKFLTSYEKPYINSLTNESPKKATVLKMKVPLRAHQLAIIEGMEQIEQKMTSGWDYSPTKKIYGNYAFLGDNVGVGKSLMVLAHIASSKKITQVYHTSKESSKTLFDINKKKCKVSNSLIIVPHTIYKQWVSYIQDQTDLTFLGITSHKSIPDTENKFDVDIILITNTMLHLLHPYKMSFDRIFIDEADSIHITNGSMPFEYNFIWFITATWMNLVSIHMYLYTDALNTYFSENPTVNHEFKKYILSIGNYGSYIRFETSIRSSYILQFFNLNNHINYDLILRCSDAFIKESTKIPDSIITTYRCRGNLSHKIVSDFISEEVKSLLHAGDSKGALQILGIQTETPISLIDAVKHSKKAELDRLHQDLQVARIRYYVDEQSKAAAIKRIEGKIASLMNQIEIFKERLENTSVEPCGICYDVPECPALTPCCSQIFCTKCIFESLSHFKGCPMCRCEPFNVKMLHYISDATETNVFETVAPEKLPKKEEMLMKILLENPDGKFLIFSRYDNPFETLQATIHNEGITVAQLKGTKNTITSRIKKFSEGKIKVLLLNNQYSGSGLNIIATTHIILWHAMSVSEEKQIIGRALRLGRTEDVAVIKLLNEDE